jgi:hypothetical protein
MPGNNVIISNIIQVQKSIRRIDDDLPFFQVHLYTNRLSEGDQHFPRSFFNDQKVIFSDEKDILNQPDETSVFSDDRTSTELEKVVVSSIKRLEIFLRNPDLLTRVIFCLT